MRSLFPEQTPGVHYQCYGDPSFRLKDNHSETKASSLPRAYFSPSEFIVDFENVREFVRMETRDYDDEALKLLGSDIGAHISRIPKAQEKSWLQRADVAASMGFGYAWLESNGLVYVLQQIKRNCAGKTSSIL